MLNFFAQKQEETFSTHESHVNKTSGVKLQGNMSNMQEAIFQHKVKPARNILQTNSSFPKLHLHYIRISSTFRVITVDIF